MKAKITLNGQHYADAIADYGTAEKVQRRDHLAYAEQLRAAARDDQRRMFGLIRSIGAVFGRASVAELEAVAEQTVEHYDEAYLAMSRALDVEADRLRDQLHRAEQERGNERAIAGTYERLLIEALAEQQARSRKQGKPLPEWAQQADDRFSEPF